MVDDEDFIKMMGKVDKRLTKITNLVDKMYLAEKLKFKQRLATAGIVSIGLDIKRTKKGLTASFLEVTACYFYTEDNKSEHILLNLQQMVHPHIAQSIAALVDECTEEWGIPKENVTIITDNGSGNLESDEEGEADERSACE